MNQTVFQYRFTLVNLLASSRSSRRTGKPLVGMNEVYHTSRATIKSSSCTWERIVVLCNTEKPLEMPRLPGRVAGTTKQLAASYAKTVKGGIYSLAGTGEWDSTRALGSFPAVTLRSMKVSTRVLCVNSLKKPEYK